MIRNIVFLTTILFASFFYSTCQEWDLGEVQKFSSAVNTDAEESNLIFAKDSTSLFFTRTFDKRNKGGFYDQDIWYCERQEDGSYSVAQPLKKLNNKLNNAVVGISTDGKRLYVLNAYEKGKNAKKGLAVSELGSNGKWGKPKRIDIPNLSISGDFYGFYISESEKHIIISYHGENSLGEEDLYISLYANGKWSEPLHLGNTINSKGFEIGPFLSSNLDTLFFASNGHHAEGKSDLFYSLRQHGDWTNWSAPIALNSELNSPKFDAFLSFNKDKVFWTSNREDERTSIYTASILPPPALEIASKRKLVTSTPEEAYELSVEIISGVGPYTYKWGNNEEKPTITVTESGVYSIEVTDKLGRVAYEEILVEITVPEIVAIPFEPIEELIYFDLDSDKLNAENIATLEELLPILSANEELHIFVESHCDIRASIWYNEQLSQRRMLSTKAFFKQNGISVTRITGAFKGKLEPKIDCGNNCTEEQHRINRRTVLKVYQKNDLEEKSGS